MYTLGKTYAFHYRCDGVSIDHRQLIRRIVNSMDVVIFMLRLWFGKKFTRREKGFPLVVFFYCHGSIWDEGVDKL
jgi:hypothetical protein